MHSLTPEMCKLNVSIEKFFNNLCTILECIWSVEKFYKIFILRRKSVKVILNHFFNNI